ncbi:hypothetical protein DB30_07058 [Enhygromyxa salina]|uniref:Polymer-forming cytoskeletal n=1 Tax=Enhygromyxa salina TaxID=215803 RepID=A0A0C2CX76_9BACT|nr:hypothetical protein [Enhygromyxa salina]KIG14200.1 hypothetical protein DB30_07058 [Enhygromyxa salina]
MWVSQLVKAVCLALVAIAVFAVPVVADAAEVRKGDHVEVTASEIVDDTLIALAQSVVIKGHVRGDAVVFARSVIVEGTIDGDLLTAARRVDIRGTVAGSVIMAGQDVTIGASVASQLYVAGQTIHVGPATKLGGDAMLTGSEIEIAGTVGRDVYAMGDRVDVDAATSRDLVIGGEDLRVGGTATVGRNLTAKVGDAEDVVVDRSALVRGSTNVEVGAIADNNPYDEFSFYAWHIAMIGAGLICGLVGFALVPGLFRAPQQQGQWLRMLGIGAVGLFLVPIGSVVAAATLIGLPLAMVAMAGYLIALYVGKLVIAAELGRRILRFPSFERRRILWSLLLGLVIVTVLIELPYVGGVIAFIVAVLGFGAVGNYLLMRNRLPSSGAPQRTHDPGISK